MGQIMYLLSLWVKAEMLVLLLLRHMHRTATDVWFQGKENALDMR